MKPAKWILILLGLAGLTACNIHLSDREQIKHLRPLPNINKTVHKQAKQSAFIEEGDWPEADWWKIYSSPRLNQLMASAFTVNPTLQEARYRYDRAKAEAIITGSELFPLVFFDSDLNQQYLSKNGLYKAFNPRLPRNAHVINLALSFDYEFDFWGQYHNLFRASLGEVKAQEAELAQVKLIVSTALAQAYFAYETNLKRQSLYRQLVQVRQSILNLQQLLLNKGLSSDLPPLQLAEDLNEAKKQLASIDAEVEINRHLVNTLAGKSPDAPLFTRAQLPKLPQQLVAPKAIYLDLIARRPDLMAEIWRAKAWAYRTSAAMAEYYPNVNVVGLIGLQSVAWQKLFNISSGTTAIRPALHLPIFTAGEIAANIRANRDSFEAAIAAYNQLLLNSTQEVLDNLSFGQSVYQQKQEQDKIVTLAKQRYDLTALRLQKGLDNQLTLYLYQEALIRNQLNDVVLLYNQYLASVKLIKSLGGGYCQKTVPLAKRA